MNFSLISYCCQRAICYGNFLVTWARCVGAEFQSRVVIWSMASESMTQEFERGEFETLNAWETNLLPESAKEQAPEGFSNDSNNLFSLSISSLNSPSIGVSFSSFGGLLLVRFACPWTFCCCPLLGLHPLLLLLKFSVLPCNFQHISLVCPGFL